jgi:hypothetical protein
MLFCSIQLASAQSAFDLNLGVGAVQDKAASGQVDQNLNQCTTGDLYGPCVSTPALSGATIGFGGDLMLWKKKFGVGAEVAIQPAKETYVNLNASAAAAGVNTLAVTSRMTLFDFNGIYQPVNTKKVAVKLEGGIGDANLKFYENASSSSVLGSQNSSQYFGSANHFQVHGGLGVQIYINDHIYIRPEFDVHYVRNLTQFGSNLVTSEMVWLGYSWGDR